MSPNRFVNWIKAFDYKVKNETELIDIIENYITRECNNQINSRTKAPNILLASYKSSQYSVPCNYIGKYVDVISVGSELYIYHNHSLITVYTLTEEPIN